MKIVNNSRVFPLTPFLLLFLFSMNTSIARAELTSVSETGFAISFKQETSASPDQAYEAMTRIGQWWDADHSWEGVPENLYLDMRLGGCFCEKLSNGGGVEHLRLVYFAPGKEIRLSGGLGPLQGMGMGGTLVWAISPGEPGNTINWTYNVHGHGSSESMAKLAPVVDYVQRQAFERLMRYIETGNPEEPRAD